MGAGWLQAAHVMAHSRAALGHFHQEDELDRTLCQPFEALTLYPPSPAHLQAGIRTWQGSSLASHGESFSVALGSSRGDAREGNVH